MEQYAGLVVFVLVVVGIVTALRWMSKNGQFDEDIKYLVFNKDDQDKMSPEEFKKSQEVLRHQMVLRDQAKVKE